MKMIFVALLLVCSMSGLVHGQKTSVLVITGGHDFEEMQFFKMFDAFEIEYDHLIQPKGNEAFESGLVNEYEVVVFYDMFQDITESQKAAYLKSMGEGRGMVFLHHSLVSYQNWPEFKKIIGGKYHLQNSDNHSKSTYKHDVNFDVHIINTNHPITNRLSDFMIHDETYGNYEVIPSVEPLLSTNQPTSAEVIGRSHTYLKSKIVYIQLGHDHFAYEDPNYRKLVSGAISWVAR